ncbi:MAG: leucine-rich repeat domain-containing protein [Spirochaetaceae bacterium]|nr:leucine-rich repeat domain-containing protein [Spirochaetaceae bacterium]
MIRQADKKFFLPVLIVAALLAVLCASVLCMAGCQTSGPSSGQDTKDGGGQSGAAADMNAAPGGTVSGRDYWTGNGASGLSIAVLVPEGRGLAKTEEYLPTMVQGVVVGDFTNFSAMKVLDRENLDKVLAGGERGFYENENNFIQLGSAANVQYVLNGALQKTGSGFSLELKVTDAASGASKAAYTGNVTAAELENLTGIKEASGDLLAQLGVSLTDAEKANLLGALTSNAAAETALAKGITAQRSGMVVEALICYYEAAKFDPDLAEAASRSSVLWADIMGGNTGQNGRNDIQRRAAWNKVFHEAAAFFKEHPPFEIIYDPALTIGNIDYEKETVALSFNAKMVSTTGFKVIYDLAKEMEKTGKSREWGISVNSIYNAIPREYTFNAILINEDQAVIGTASGKFNPDRKYDFGYTDATVVFSGVDVNKTSGNLTVSITSVNGIDAKTAGERGYIGIFAGDFAGLENQFKVNWWLGGIRIAEWKERGGKQAVVIPQKMDRWMVTSIGHWAFARRELTSVVIPNSVTSIGDSAFYGNRLASVVIPDSVTSIGANAFAYNRLTSVVIPNRVTSIGNDAFWHNELTSIILPADVQLYEGALDGAERFYNDNGRKAGTYVKKTGAGHTQRPR